jgi:hypothetical protein
MINQLISWVFALLFLFVFLAIGIVCIFYTYKVQSYFTRPRKESLLFPVNLIAPLRRYMESPSYISGPRLTGIISRVAHTFRSLGCMRPKVAVK